MNKGVVLSRPSSHRPANRQTRMAMTNSSPIPARPAPLNDGESPAPRWFCVTLSPRGIRATSTAQVLWSPTPPGPVARLPLGDDVLGPSLSQCNAPMHRLNPPAPRRKPSALARRLSSIPMQNLGACEIFLKQTWQSAIQFAKRLTIPLKSMSDCCFPVAPHVDYSSTR